jgi:hypothetical protein
VDSSRCPGDVRGARSLATVSVSPPDDDCPEVRLRNARETTDGS